MALLIAVGAMLQRTGGLGKRVLRVCSHKVDCSRDKHHNHREHNHVF